jgi:hypothetical protein
MAEKTVDLRTVREKPGSGGFVNNFLVDPSREHGFFAAYHPGQRLVFGYVFSRAEFPWLNIWESNTDDMLARGMEFSNTPVHGTMKALMKSPTLFGTPTYEWLNAKSKTVKHFMAFSTRVPAGFQGVSDVQVTPHELVIVERGSAHRISLPIGR